MCVWDAATGALLSSLPGQQGSRVKEMSASRDGQLLGVVLFDSSTAVRSAGQGSSEASQMRTSGHWLGVALFVPPVAS